MIIRKNDSNLEVNEPGNKVFDYPMPTDQAGFSYQELDGRVPKKGAGKNFVCLEYFYVLAGRADVWIDDIKFDAGPGDIVIINQGCCSYLIAHELKMLTITKPDWYAEQYEICN